MRTHSTVICTILSIQLSNNYHSTELAKINPDGAAAQEPRLHTGMRIIEVRLCKCHCLMVLYRALVIHRSGSNLAVVDHC